MGSERWPSRTGCSPPKNSSTECSPIMAVSGRLISQKRSLDYALAIQAYLIKPLSTRLPWRGVDEGRGEVRPTRSPIAQRQSHLLASLGRAVRRQHELE